MSTKTEATPKVSRNCATGKHRRCLGTVRLYPQSALVPCQCTAEGCDHGPALARV